MTKTNALGILFQRKAIRVRTMKACPCLPLLMLPSRKARKLPLVLPPLVWHAFHTLRLRILRHFLCHKSIMNHFPTSIPTRQTSARRSGAGLAPLLRRSTHNAQHNAQTALQKRQVVQLQQETCHGCEQCVTFRPALGTMTYLLADVFFYDILWAFAKIAMYAPTQTCKFRGDGTQLIPPLT